MFIEWEMRCKLFLLNPFYGQIMEYFLLIQDAALTNFINYQQNSDF